MPKKYIVFLKSIGRKWFLFLIGVILIVYFYNMNSIYHQIAAITITVIAIGLFVCSYIPGLLLKRKLVKFIVNYYRIEDDFIAKKLKRPLRKIQQKMFNLSQKQKKKDWLIVFLNKHYIYYHEQTIEEFKKLYRKGFGDKELFEELKESDLRTKEEIKAITETLIKFNRLEKEREISVKEKREKERYQNF